MDRHLIERVLREYDLAAPTLQVRHEGEDRSLRVRGRSRSFASRPASP